MARCEGTTRSGDQCKRDAREGTTFCHIHGRTDKDEGGEAGEVEDLEFGDFVPILLAGVMTAGLVLFLKTFGRWIPKI